MTREQAIKEALAMIADAIVDSVKVAGRMGAPAGTIYAALMASGCTLDQFNQIMAALVNVGKLRREGHLYFAV